MFVRVLVTIARPRARLGRLARVQGAAPEPSRRRGRDTLWSIASDYAGDPREGVWKIQRERAAGTRSSRGRGSCFPALSAGRPPRLAAWTSTSSSSARPARCRPPSGRRARCSSGAGASACSSTAARGRSGSSCARNRPRRAARGLPHALPRRPLPRPAGDAEEVRAARPGAPITIYGPPGLGELFAALRRIFGRLTYRYELVELRARRARSTAAGTRSRRSRSSTACGVGYALVEEPRPGRFDVEAPTRSAFPRGRSGARSSAARR